MKKAKSILLSALFLPIVAAALFLTACSSGSIDGSSKTVTLFFNTSGGSEVATMVLSEKDSLQTTQPTKEGYTFVGWYLDEEYSVPLTLGAIDFTSSSVSAYAKWDKKSYTVTFDSQGGSMVDSQTVLYGDHATEAFATKNGFDLGGWFTDANCSSEYGFDSIVVSDLILYAKWLPKKAIVNYVTNGGDSLDSAEYSIGDTIKLPAATRTNYDLEGWYEEEELVYKVGSAGTRVTLEAGATTYYAKWTPHKFTIIFDSNEGSVVPQQTYDYGDAISLPKNVTKDNYEFVAWCTDEECQNEVDFSVGFSKVTYLYAKYVAKKHTFSFDVMGGDKEISPYTARWDDVNLPSPTKTGCTFVGWYCADANNVYAAEFDKEQYAADKGTAGDLTLYAKWEANEYTVSFHTFSSANVDSIIGKYGDVIQKPDDPIEDGRIFAGWYTSPTLYDEYKYTFDENSTIPADGLELYAKWDLKEWTITLKYKKVDASGNEKESGDIAGVSCTSNYSSFWLDNFDSEFNKPGSGQDFINNLGTYNAIRILDEGGKEIGDVSCFDGTVFFLGTASLPTTPGDYDYTLTLVCSPSEKTVTINLDEEGNDKLVYKLKIDTQIGEFLYNSNEVKGSIERRAGKELYGYAYIDEKGEAIPLQCADLNQISGDATLEAIYYKLTLTLHVSNVMHVQDERDVNPGEVSYSTETVVLSRDSDPQKLVALFNDVYYQNYKNADFKGVFITDTETMIIDENGNICDSGLFDILPDEIEADCAYGYENIDYEEFGSGYIITKIGDFNKDYTRLVLDEYRGHPIVGIAAHAASSSVRTDYTIYAPNVVFIGDSAFQGSFIKAFLYGNKVSKIGAHAFDGSRLETGVFEGANLVIGTNAFANCTKLKELTLSHVSELGAVPFVGCSELVTVHADKNAPLKKIGASAFQNCKKLVTCDLLTISGLETVGNYAFKGCSAMTAEITVALKEIGIRAFEGCKKITKVALTASLKKLGMGAFASCTGLQTVSMVAVANQAVDVAIFIGCGTGFTIDILDTGNYIKKWNKDWAFSGSAASVKYSVRTK